MQKKKLFLIFSVFFILSLISVSALPDDADATIDFEYPESMNYSLIPTVNDSLYWQGHTGTDGSWLTGIVHNDLTGLQGGGGEGSEYYHLNLNVWDSVTSFLDTSNFVDNTLIIGSGINLLFNDGNVTADYGFLDSLNVTGDSYFGNIFPQESLTYDLGSGSNRWLWGYFANISAEYIDVFGITASENITANGFCNAGGCYNLSTIGGGNASWNESLANDLYVNVIGDTMTGDLVAQNITGNYINLSGGLVIGEGADDFGEAGGYIAVGLNAEAGGGDSVAMGTECDSGGGNSVAMGYYAITGGNGAISMGQHTYAYGQSSVAMGEYTNALGEHSIAIGSYTNSTGNYSSAFGRYIEVIGNNSVGFGMDDTLYTINENNLFAIMGGNFRVVGETNLSGDTLIEGDLEMSNNNITNVETIETNYIKNPVNNSYLEMDKNGDIVIWL